MVQKHHEPTINGYQGLITSYPSDHNICHIKTIEINLAIPSAKEIRGQTHHITS